MTCPKQALCYVCVKNVTEMPKCLTLSSCLRGPLRRHRVRAAFPGRSVTGEHVTFSTKSANEADDTAHPQKASVECQKDVLSVRERGLDP